MCVIVGGGPVSIFFNHNNYVYIIDLKMVYGQNSIFNISRTKLALNANYKSTFIQSPLMIKHHRFS